MSKQYVQHVSGQGEKWEVVTEDERVWIAYLANPHRGLVLPKSEYRLCEPPERWVDVTEQCEERWGEIVARLTPENDVNKETFLVIAKKPGYRLRKVQVVLAPSGSFFETGVPLNTQSAFIIEKKEVP